MGCGVVPQINTLPSCTFEVELCLFMKFIDVFNSSKTDVTSSGGWGVPDGSLACFLSRVAGSVPILGDGCRSCVRSSDFTALDAKFILDGLVMVDDIVEPSNSLLLNDSAKFCGMGKLAREDSS